MTQMLDSDLSAVELRSYFVRGRNALLVRGRFGPLYLDYYLHLMQHSIQQNEKLDAMLKDALAALGLHLCSRPRDEVAAWTIHFEEPLVNLFVTGRSFPGRLTGRIFTEDVREGEPNRFIAQSTRPEQPSRQSMVSFEGKDVLAAMEAFYTQSEQRLTRAFRLEEEEYVQISAEPDCDEEWLAALTLEDVLKIGETHHLTLLETRSYVFECGCSLDRLYPMLLKIAQEDLDYVFEEGAAIVTCPRCAAVFKAERDSFDAWREEQDRG